MRLKICTEADYLNAHITALGADSRSGSPMSLKLRFKLWAASLLRRWNLSLR